MARRYLCRSCPRFIQLPALTGTCDIAAGPPTTPVGSDLSFMQTKEIL